MIRAVLFDMDGTLFDTERMTVWGWQQLVDRGEAPAEIIPLYPSFCGKKREVVKEIVAEHFGADFPLEAYRAKIAELVRAEFDRIGVPFKHFVPQIFESLKKMGIRSALVTSTSTPSVEDYLQRTGIGAHFGSIVTGDRVQNGKPAPDCFLLAARELGVAPSECLVAEDSPTGIEAAFRAGMRAVMIPDLIPPTSEVRDRVIGIIPTLEALPELIEKENLK